MPASDPARRCVLGSRQVRFMVKRACVNNELQHISRRLTGLCMKRPGLALGVWGEPGIGKTHTALVLLRGIPCQTKTVHATQALEKILLALAHPKKLTLWLEKILERLTKGKTLELGILNQALVALLAANAPIILQVEDLHEASPERLEFFKQLALGVVRTRGVGLIVTSRAQPPEGFEAIRLTPLNREESDALLEAEASARLPSEALAWLFERAAGNPLFTVEFFRLLARQGSLWNNGQRWRFRTPEHETMPVTVEALIEQVLHETASTPALENAIGAKAMLGLGASEQLWAEVAGLMLEDLSVVKQELEHRGVISNGEFAHPLFREVVTHGLQPEQRQGFARRALEVLEGDPRVAAEFVKDANLEPEVAFERFEKAVQAAKNAGDEIQSARFKVNAIEYASGKRRAIMAFEAGQALEKTNLSEAIRLLQISLEEQPKHADTIFWLAGCYATRGESGEVEKLLGRISDDEKMQTGWIKRQISLRFALGDYAGVLERWKADSRLHNDPDPILAYNVGFARSTQGDQEGAETIALAALKEPQINALNRARLWVVCGLSWHYREEQVTALTCFDKAVAAAVEAKNPAFTAATLHNRSMVWEHTSQEVQMLVDTEEALRLYAEVGIVRNYASTLTKKARILHEMGEYERAEECFQESRTILLQNDASIFLVTCECLLSELYLDWQPSYGSALAIKHAELALRVARPMGGFKFCASLQICSLVEAKQGNATRSLALIEECIKLLEAAGSKCPHQVLSTQGLALAQLGEVKMATAILQEAYDLVLATDWRVYAEKINLEIARITNDFERARTSFAWFKDHNLMNGVNIAIRYFPELATNHTPKTSRLSIPESIPHLEVLGSMQILLESQITPVRGRKRQELLALLLEARISGRSEVSRLELVDKLYPDADEIQSNAGLRDVIYQLRSSLGENTLTTTMNGYALGSLKTDVETFLETGNTQLWRGIYLEGLTLETSDTVRESIYLALRTRAEVLLETDPVEVTRVGRLLCEADPYDLEALRLTVTGLRAGQNHRSLSRFYDQARTRFLEIGEVLPARWQDFLTPIGTIA
jgi:tetratricopeptide (TPR) repeat protein